MSDATTTQEVTTPSVVYEIGQLYHLNPFDINRDENQPRKEFDPEEMAALTESVAKYGVIEPIIVRLENGSVIIIAGERRTKAARDAGLEKIPAIFSDKNPAEVAIVENMLRSDLSPMEEAEAVKRLKDEAKFKNKEIAVIIGKAESTVSEILSLNILPDSIKNRVRGDKKYTRAELIKIAGKGKDAAAMLQEFETLVAQKAGAAPAAKPQPSPSEQFKSKIVGFVKNLQALDMDELEESARTSVIEQLETLATLIKSKTVTA